MPVEFDSLSQGNREGFHTFLVGSFLAIGARDLFDPAYPPVALLSDDCGVGVGVLHGNPLTEPILQPLANVKFWCRCGLPKVNVALKCSVGGRKCNVIDL